MGEENSQIVLIFIISGAFVMLLAILLILFLVIYQKRIIKQENRLHKLENERQKVLLKATIEGQEKERQRLAKDLHDGIGSLLSGLSLNLKFQKKLESPLSKQAAFLAEAVEMVDEGIKDVRRVSHNLMPPTLERFGLVAAIKECSQHFQNDGLKINITAINSPAEIPKEKSVGLLRIYQELLNNTYKHAEASEINVRVEYRDEKVRMQYHDNGKGFEFDEANAGGLGLKSMQSRIMALNGSMEINKELKTGFEAVFEAPLVLNDKNNG